MIKIQSKLPHALTICVTAFLIVSCGGLPTREDGFSFNKVLSGQVSVNALPNFTDCSLEGFNRVLEIPGVPFWIQRMGITEKNFSEFKRIESVNAVILASLDIHKNGRVELYVPGRLSSANFNARHEISAVQKCLDQFQKK